MKTIKYLLVGVLLLTVAASCNTNDGKQRKEILTKEAADVNASKSSFQQEQIAEEHVLLADAYVVRRANKTTEQANTAAAILQSNLAVMEGMAGELEKDTTVIDRIKGESIELASVDEPVVAIDGSGLANVEDRYEEIEANIQGINKLQEGESSITMANLQGDFNIQEFEDIIQGVVATGNWEFIDRDNKEIWRTKLADGSHLSYKLKGSEYKSVFKEHDENSRDFIKEKETENKYVEKVKEDGHRKVKKVKNKGDEIVVKERYNGIKSIERIRV